MKDNFSHRSDNYAKFRPTYPQELFDLTNDLIPLKNTAWDCATGNGQIAFQLAKTFQKVYATDISENQLKNAQQEANIDYSSQPAERTDFKNHSFELITVGQAIHWFDFDQFYKEVKRVSKPGALLVVAGYGLHQIDEQIDFIVHKLYEHILGSKYWDKERKYIEQAYQTIPFPFEEINSPKLVSKYQWSLNQLIGYLSTWSAVKHYHNKNGQNPIDQIVEELKNAWPANVTKVVSFPILLRIGKIS